MLRPNATQPVLLSATFVKAKCSFRWQVRSWPPLNGAELSCPGEALQAFLNKHRASLQEASCELIAEHVPALKEHKHQLRQAKLGLRRPRPIIENPPTLPVGPLPPPAAPCAPLTWDLIEQLHTTHIAVRRVPPRAVRAALEQLIRQMLQAWPGASQLPAASDYLFVLPKILWPTHLVCGDRAKPRGRQRQRVIQRRIARAQQGDWQALAEEALRQPRLMDNVEEMEPDEDADYGQISAEAARRVLAAARRGHSTAAWRQLTATGLAPKEPASWERFLQKIKATEAAALSGNAATAVVWTPDDKDWMQAVRRLKPNKGADPGGWTHEAWQFIWEETSLQAPLITWLRALCLDPPHAQRDACVHRYRAVCLSRPDGGVRPIVISSLMRKLMCAAFVPTVRDQLQSHFKHVQYGAATPDGCLQLYAHLMALLQDQPQHCLLQTDISNAFCTLDRDAAFQSLSRLVGDAPWLAFVHHLFENDMHIAVPQWAGSDARTVRCASGIGQGDPLSSLLFAAVITEAIHSFQSRPDVKDLELSIVAYIDDCVMGGSPEAVHRALPLYVQHLERYGLHLAQDKCKIYAQERDLVRPFPQLVELLPPPSEPMGIVICGHALSVSFDDDLPLPVGSTEFQMQWLARKQAACQELLGKLREFPSRLPEGSPGLQVAFHLLNELLPAKIMHILRSMPQPLWAEWAESLQQEAQQILRSWLQLPSLAASQLAVAHLPAMRGGLGFLDLPVLGLCARAAALFSLTKEGPAGQAVATWIREERDDLYGRLQPLMRSPVTTILGDQLSPEEGRSRKAAQRRLRKQIDRTSLQTLLHGFSASGSLLGWQLQRLNHDPESGLTQFQPLRAAWLRAWPTTTATTLDDAVWRWGVHQRLGIPAAKPGDLCQHCLPGAAGPCHHPLDSYGRHAAVCQQGAAIKRHNAIRDIIAQYGRQSGMHAQVEQRLGSEIRDELRAEQCEQAEPTRACRALRTADVHFLSAEACDVYLDIRCFMLPPEGRLAVQVHSHERAKCREYGCDVPIGMRVAEGLRPFVLESAGTAGPSASLVMQWLIRQRSERLRLLQGHTVLAAAKRASSELYEPLSCALLRAGAMSQQLSRRGLPSAVAAGGEA